MFSWERVKEEGLSFWGLAMIRGYASIWTAYHQIDHLDAVDVLDVVTEPRRVVYLALEQDSGHLKRTHVTLCL